MKRVALFIKALTVLLLVFCIAVFSAIFYLSNNISENYKVPSGETLILPTRLPVTAKYSGDSQAEVKLYHSIGSTYDVQLKLFGLIPINRARVEVVDDMYVAVLGTPFGMKIYTDGVLVVALSDVDTAAGNCSPATKCGIKIGDYIVTLDGKKVYSNEDVGELIEQSAGRPINVVVKREGKVIPLTLCAEKSVSTGSYKAGIWVRDSSAGIGTLTFYYPYNNVVCGLGHGICDKDTGSLLTVNSGELVGAEIVSVKKAVAGEPGELTGRITLQKFGAIKLNSERGVYAVANNSFITENLMPIALKQEIVNGEATVITTVDGGTPKEYTCTVKVHNKNGVQNLTVKITDSELLSKTGGIVQGMSGSPIIQNGKLIGAVTHVLIDDATKGYAIFAENMLETAQNVAEGNKFKEAS